MALQMKKAARSQAYLKLGISGPSGSGKTLGGLLMAYGLLKEKYQNISNNEIWNKIAVIDTENGSGELYVGRDVNGLVIGEYNVISLEPPFDPEKYSQAIYLCEDAGMEVAIVDSLSHAWIGVGGMLDQQGNAAKRSGNSYTAWRDVTPKHNKLVDSILQSKLHIISTLRSKTEYVQEKDEKGKTTVRKVGMAPQFRDGMEYEFTTFLEVDSDHQAYGAKDRSGIMDGQYFKIDQTTGRKIMKWLQGADTSGREEIVATKATPVQVDINDLRRQVIKICTENGGSSNDELMTIVRHAESKSTGEEFDIVKGNPNKITNEDVMISLLKELQEKYNGGNK